LVELFRLVQEALVAFDPSVEASPPVHEPERLGDIPRSVADISKAKQMLRFAPQYEIAKGLSEALEWYARAASGAKS
jgi:UDP-N-acetylglucosamine 4-epimerase